MWRPSRRPLRGGYANSFDCAPEPTVRFPSTSQHMGSVPPPPSLTQPNAAGLSSVAAREMERRKEAEVRII